MSTTPPLPLAELVKKWRTEAGNCRVVATRLHRNYGRKAETVHAAAVTLDDCSDELEASLPLGRCETCRHAELWPLSGPTEEAFCLHPSVRDLNDTEALGRTTQVPVVFGCILHEVK